MKYSESRLRHGLAVIRMLIGVVYVCYGYEKLFDAAFFENGFLQRLAYWEVSVAPWYSWMWGLMSEHPSRWAVVLGGVEMFLGVALLLGLATRPACLIGMLYMVHRLFIGWFPEDVSFTLWRFFELHFEQIALSSLFWLMVVGHAGDVWGLGAIYHRVRVRWRPAHPRPVVYDYFEAEGDTAPESIDEHEFYHRA